MQELHGVQQQLENKVYEFLSKLFVWMWKRSTAAYLKISYSSKFIYELKLYRNMCFNGEVARKKHNAQDSLW